MFKNRFSMEVPWKRSNYLDSKSVNKQPLDNGWFQRFIPLKRRLQYKMYAQKPSKYLLFNKFHAQSSYKNYIFGLSSWYIYIHNIHISTLVYGTRPFFYGWPVMRFSARISTISSEVGWSTEAPRFVSSTWTKAIRGRSSVPKSWVVAI